MTDHNTTAASYLTNIIAALFGVITLQELGVVIGVILGILTYGTNLYFKYRQDKRAKEAHDKHMDNQTNNSR